MNFKTTLWVLFGFLFSSLLVKSQELPDNYLPISLTINNGLLSGESEYLKGFVFTIDLQKDSLSQIPSKKALFSAIKSNLIKGNLDYPNGKSSEISYEIVKHRGIEEIYMKTAQGYFLWEYLEIDADKISFAIYWWYHPPALKTDLKIIKLTKRLLAHKSNWHQNDDRKCEEDEKESCWSLFCALKYASLKIDSEYNHHNTPIQIARFVIDDIVPDHAYEHTLMDYNNSPKTSYQAILQVLIDTKKRIKKEIIESKKIGK